MPVAVRRAGPRGRSTTPSHAGRLPRMGIVPEKWPAAEVVPRPLRPRAEAWGLHRWPGIDSIRTGPRQPSEEEAPMRNRRALGLGVAVLTGGLAVVVATRAAQEESRRRQPAPPPDAIAEARPKGRAGRAARAEEDGARPLGPLRRAEGPDSSPALEDQPEQGEVPASTSTATR